MGVAVDLKVDGRVCDGVIVWGLVVWVRAMGDGLGIDRGGCGEVTVWEMDVTVCVAWTRDCDSDCADVLPVLSSGVITGSVLRICSMFLTLSCCTDCCN